MMTEDQLQTMRYDWLFWGRPSQMAPTGKWNTWLALCGRGWGKTEVGAQWIRGRVRDAGARSIAIIAETQKDLEEVMVPRIIRVHPPSEAPSVRYKPVRLVWPNGAIALGYNGTEPDQLRGPEFDTAWADELAKYRNAQAVWDMLQFTMRQGDPRVFVTTTPRPIPIIKAILSQEGKGTVVTRGSSYENSSNLSVDFLKRLNERYKGTRLGRQELSAEVLDDVPGALWTRALIDKAKEPIKLPPLVRVVVGVDPSGARSADDESRDEIGIIAAGLGVDGRGYVLGDYTLRGSPIEWGNKAVWAYTNHQADAVIGEANYGGAMVEFVIRSVDKNISYKAVSASRGKAVRAEPVSALYERGLISHVGEDLESLEDQLCQMARNGYVGEGSPDRLDALVWAITDLMLDDDVDIATFIKANQ